MKNIFLKVVLIGFAFFCITHKVSANILINEVMYDLDGVDIDWVEVYNPDDADVDLTTLKLLISNSSSNHGITKFSGNATLHTGEYGVIVASSVISNYTNKWGTAGNTFTSSFSLSNTSGKVEINNGDKNSPLSTLTYESSHGASGNGKSLQKISGTWQESMPTPGKENILSNSEGNDDHTTGGTGSTDQDTSDTSSTSTKSSSSTTSKKLSETKTTVEATAQTSVIFAGLATSFIGEVVDSEGRPLFYGRYFWNFGDGDSKEMKVNTGGDVSHIYFYPGEYKLTLEYYTNDYGDIPEASDSIVVKVIGADILISQVGSEQDFFVELLNNTEKDVDISKWMLTSGDKRFVFPKNTIISAKKKIIFSPLVTGFNFQDKNNLKLLNPDWKVVFDYNASVAPVPKATLSKSKISNSIANYAIAENSTMQFSNQVGAYDEVSEVSGTNLGAQAISSGVDLNHTKYFYFIILFVLLVASSGAIYFIRRSKHREVSEAGEDFDILDE